MTRFSRYQHYFLTTQSLCENVRGKGAVFILAEKIESDHFRRRLVQCIIKRTTLEVIWFRIKIS